MGEGREDVQDVRLCAAARGALGVGTGLGRHPWLVTPSGGC
jgi:hypothetical protein